MYNYNHLFTIFSPIVLRCKDNFRQVSTSMRESATVLDYYLSYYNKVASKQTTCVLSCDGDRIIWLNYFILFTSLLRYHLHCVMFDITNPKKGNVKNATTPSKLDQPHVYYTIHWSKLLAHFYFSIYLRSR